MKKNQPLTIFSAVFLFSLIFSCSQKEEHPASTPEYRVGIELVFANGEVKDSVINAQGFKTDLEIFHWKNHMVLFGEAIDTSGLSAIIRDFPLVKKKRYDSPLYAFDKVRHCKDRTIAEDWKNYLLTANLVEDTTLQQEYMDYHKNQFEEWPEVAQGFCHAQFQQLLVFRSGRQLLLIISIPADQTLDELNPKTIENNPRMVEWNQLMSKYQEGIEGTGEGEVWVFLEPYQASFSTE